MRDMNSCLNTSPVNLCKTKAESSVLGEVIPNAASGLS